MDARAFDRLARRFGGLSSRRGFLAALGAAMSATFGRAPTEAAEIKQGCGKARQRCRRDKDCCPEFSCFAGKCACSKLGHNPCGKRCLDLKTHNRNCGRCGKRCRGDLRCAAGVCSCPSNKDAQCGARCVDLATNQNHCGTCGNACTGDLTCIAGACACAGGLTACGTACADLQTDPDHCGDCATACPGDLICAAGSCACPAGERRCPGDVCADPASDPNNCGACGVVCPGEQTCVGGACACPTGGCVVDAWTGTQGGAEPLREPWGIAVRADRTVLVADRAADDIRAFTRAGANLDRWRAVGVAWLAQDAGGDLYATFPGHDRVARYAGTPANPVWTTGVVTGPQGVAAFSDVAVYVAADADQLFRLNPADGAVVWATGRTGSDPGELAAPRGVAVDLDHRVYVADSGNDRIAVFSSAGNWVRNIDDAGLSGPHGVAAAGDRLLVADTGNRRVVLMSKTGEVVAELTTAGDGRALRRPVGVAADRDGNVLVTDAELGRVLVARLDESAGAATRRR